MTLLATARAGARHLALETSAARQQATDRGQEAFGRPRIHLLYLHAVPGREEEGFRRFLEALAQHHTFIGYSEAVRRIREGGIDRPYVSLSFDDGFRSTVRVAEILEEYGAVDMFFVPLGFIGIGTVKEAREFYGFRDGCDEPAMTWVDLERMLARGRKIGNHTVGHQVLPWVSTQEAKDEISRTAEVLRARLGCSEHFAWPRGRFCHFTPQAASHVFATGHVSCASAERGAHVAANLGGHVAANLGGVEDLCLRRDHSMTSWPLRPSMYFLTRRSSRAEEASNQWPARWPLR